MVLLKGRKYNFCRARMFWIDCVQDLRMDFCLINFVADYRFVSWNWPNFSDERMDVTFSRLFFRQCILFSFQLHLSLSKFPTILKYKLYLRHIVNQPIFLLRPLKVFYHFLQTNLSVAQIQNHPSLCHLAFFTLVERLNFSASSISELN